MESQVLFGAFLVDLAYILWRHARTLAACKMCGEYVRSFGLLLVE